MRTRRTFHILQPRKYARVNIYFKHGFVSSVAGHALSLRSRRHLRLRLEVRPQTDTFQTGVLVGNALGFFSSFKNMLTQQNTDQNVFSSYHVHCWYTTFKGEICNEEVLERAIVLQWKETVDLGLSFIGLTLTLICVSPSTATNDFLALKSRGRNVLPFYLSGTHNRCRHPWLNKEGQASFSFSLVCTGIILPIDFGSNFY